MGETLNRRIGLGSFVRLRKDVKSLGVIVAWGADARQIRWLHRGQGVGTVSFEEIEVIPGRNEVESIAAKKRAIAMEAEALQAEVRQAEKARRRWRRRRIGDKVFGAWCCLSMPMALGFFWSEPILNRWPGLGFTPILGTAFVLGVTLTAILWRKF